MGTIIRGGFKDNKERLVTIDIWSPLGTGEYDLNDEDSPIKISFDSIDIEYDIDDMFEVIIKKTMSIDFVTTTYFGDVLFSDRIKQVKVTVKLEDNVLFAGYVEPYTYSQEYSEKLNEFTLNCVDDLGCLEYEYMYKHADWKKITNREQPISFKDYLSMILPTNTYYDLSKKVNGASALEKLGVSQEIFLGDSEDKMKNNEEALEIILKYLNLHIIQEGENVCIFDWNTIKGKSSSQMFVNIFDSSNIKYLNMNSILVDKNAYNDDSTNISVSDTYNQIKLKVNMDTNDTVITDPLDSDQLQYYSNYKQLWFSDYLAYGWYDSQEVFKNIVKQGYEHPNTISDSNDNWERRDWYFKLAYNPQWKLMWNGVDTKEWIQRNASGKPINLSRPLEAMRSYRFFPVLMAMGKCEKHLNRNNPSRMTSDGSVIGNIPSNNYIVISVNGNEDNSSEELTRIQNAIDRSSGYDYSTDTYQGLLEYIGTTSGQYSPTDDDTTNYMVFKGTFRLNPIAKVSGWAEGGWMYMYYNTLANSSDNINFKSIYDAVSSDRWIFPQYEQDIRYCHQFWKQGEPGTPEYSAPNSLMLYPLVDIKGNQALEYNYSGHWDDTDRYDKFGVLECEMKIGDKYLVETYPNGDAQHPAYGWYTEENLPYVNGRKKRTFSLGFDPSIGQYIIGPEYPITNTVNGKVSDEKGMAVPIKKSDALSGKISFRIIAVINQQWNVITRRHPTLFRSTKYYDNWYNVWSYVSSIWIKDFSIDIISDNKGADVVGSKKDLVYMSNMTQDIIRSKDDEEFDIVTQPTTDELLANGIETNIAKNTCIDLSTKMPSTGITDTTQNITDRAERLWVDQYWNIYNKPKCIVNTKLDDSYLKGLNVYNFNTFGDTIPLKIIHNLRNCEMEISLQQINQNT